MSIEIDAMCNGCGTRMTVHGEEQSFCHDCHAELISTIQQLEHQLADAQDASRRADVIDEQLMEARGEIVELTRALRAAEDEIRVLERILGES